MARESNAKNSCQTYVKIVPVENRILCPETRSKSTKGYIYTLSALFQVAEHKNYASVEETADKK